MIISQLKIMLILFDQELKVIVRNLLFVYHLRQAQKEIELETDKICFLIFSKDISSI